MYPTISLGPLVFPTAGLLYILGAWLSLNLVERASRRLRLPAEPVYSTAAVGLFTGVIGARLVFVWLYWPAYREHLISILWPLNSGYNLWGGLLIGLAAAFFYGRARRLQLAPTLDALAPGLLLALLILSLTDFLAGPGFGKATTVPWGISQFGIRRHPVQIYEIIVGLTALVAWWWSARQRFFAGQLFLLATSIYSGGRLIVEAFRANAWLTGSGLHMLQIVSLMIMLASLYLLGRLSDRAIGLSAEDRKLPDEQLVD